MVEILQVSPWNPSLGFLWPHHKINKLCIRGIYGGVMVQWLQPLDPALDPAALGVSGSQEPWSLGASEPWKTRKVHDLS